MSNQHYDALETREPAMREREQLAALPQALAHALKAPGWAKQLAGVDPMSVDSRAALARLPVLRKADLVAMQKDNPPFGGLNITPANRAKRLLMSPGPIFEPEGEGFDWWGAARACFAAGFRLGDIVHNSFAYHLTPGGFILESGAHAVGCAVIPAGIGNTEQQLEAMRTLTWRTIGEDQPLLSTIKYRQGVLTKDDRTLAKYLALVRDYPRAHPSAAFIR